MLMYLWGEWTLNFMSDTKNVLIRGGGEGGGVAPAYRSAMTSPGPEIIIKMTLELFHKVPAGAIETLFDEQN